MNALDDTARRPSCRMVPGFSLIELLVAMTLGLLLLSGMIAVFAGNKRSTELNDATANMQENVRFALNAIAADVRMAGHQGCTSLDGGGISINAANVPMSDPTAGLRASAVTGAVVESATSWAPDLPLGTPPVGFSIPTVVEPVVGTHALAVQFGDPRTAQLSGPMSVAGFPSLSGPVSALATTESLGIQVGDYAIVSNCFAGDLFQVTGVSAAQFMGSPTTELQHFAPQNVGGNLAEIYGTPATAAQTRVMRFNSNVYFVADTGQTNESGDPITALYQQSLPYNDADNPPTEIVQGVENLRLSFGVQNALGQLQYQPPDASIDPTQIRAVRIGLLMTSRERIAQQDDATTYVLAGQSIAPRVLPSDSRGETHAGDQRFRLAFNTTVKVRNYR